MYDNATSQLYLLEWWESGSYLWTLLLSLITLDAKNCLRIERKKSWSPHFTIFLINSYLSFPMFHFWLCPAYKATILFIGKDAVVKETQNWSILIFKQFNKPFTEERTKFDKKKKILQLEADCWMEILLDENIWNEFNVLTCKLILLGESL